MDDNVPGAGASSWERRRAWPLLLGSAVTLTGLAALNYSWADPDGRLTDKAQEELSQKFPNAKVRVHGRDAIITGMPVGADIDAAHDLVRSIEGVRNVKEDTVAADAAVAAELADSIAQDSRADGTAVVTTVVAQVDTAVDSAVDSGASDAGGAPAVVTTDTPTTTAPPETVAPVTTSPETVAPVTTSPETPTTTTSPETVASVTTTPAPLTVAAAPAQSGEGGAPADAPPMKFLFDSVSSELAGESATAVDRLVAYLEANPDVRIKVIGHADGWGTRLTNLAVSRARTGSVVSALVAGRVDRGRITAFAQGDRVPVASNATADGRAANRRVEIVFFGAEGSGDREVAFTG